ncbi:MAG TPA: glycosyltransferase family 39 protein [Chthoniobacterales bacterium]|nr:glycosyltransferase family 39 protein [Chthoniobacterales bacterium]
MPLKTFWTAIALVAAATVIFGWLAWKCDRDPKINFLPRDERAEWVVFPAAVDARSHRVAMMDATFRRTLNLESQPGSARLLVRAAKRIELKINGETVQTVSTRNWKQISTLDVSKFFRTGPNTIEARVFNDDAPPALWLTLTADSSTLRTDDKWEVSLAGSTRRSSALASTPKRAGPGNLLAGGERIFDVLPKIWRTWTVFAVLAVLLTIAVGWWSARITANPNGGDAKFSRPQLFALLGLCSIAWFILFWNNAKMLPFPSGYDSKDHIAYIKYIQDHGALPLPNEGFEMFQPPLYYAFSAGVLSSCRLAVVDDVAVIVLRALTMIFGIANFILVFLSMRLLFPGRLIAQMVGLLTAAFLPMQLYLSHYVTNETLAATLATATIYLGLRTLTSQRAPASLYLWLGVCTGLAMLGKATSLLLIPPLFGALMIKLLQERASISGWFRAFGVTIAAILVTCGWHYVRIWHHFGTPVVGNWDPALGFPWWQDPGFHVAGDYFRFSAALIAPLFSGFNGFADGIYSTLWGDSLCGGLSGLLSRTPWNYQLMIGGYWLALFPTLLIAVGAAVAIYRFTRHPSPEWFLLLGLSAAVTVALIFMTLRVPSYAQVKAFYGLSAIVPFCAFAVTGWQMLTARSRVLQLVFGTVLMVFAINSFGSVWIRGSTQQHIYTALRSLSQSQPDRALSEATEATKDEPSNASAYYILAAILDEIGDSPKAVAQSEHGLELDSANGDCHLQLGISLAKQGDMTRAISEARRALELRPENARAYDLAFTLARELHHPEALAVGRDALAVSPFDPDLHYRVGLAAGELGNFQIAVPQFAYALLLQSSRAEVESKLHLAVFFAAKSATAPEQLAAIASTAPESPILLNELAWILATHPDAAVRNGAEAVRQSERACTLTKRKRPHFVATLAAAYAEAGKFSEAIATAQEAATLARSIGETKTARRAENLLTALQANQPYREEPRP